MYVVCEYFSFQHIYSYQDLSDDDSSDIVEQSDTTTTFPSSSTVKKRTFSQFNFAQQLTMVQRPSKKQCLERKKLRFKRKLSRSLFEKPSKLHKTNSKWITVFYRVFGVDYQWIPIKQIFTTRSKVSHFRKWCEKWFGFVGDLFCGATNEKLLEHDLLQISDVDDEIMPMITVTLSYVPVVFIWKQQSVQHCQIIQFTDATTIDIIVEHFTKRHPEYKFKQLFSSKNPVPKSRLSDLSKIASEKISKFCHLIGQINIEMVHKGMKVFLF